jgi:hypothetical protein
MFKPSMGEDESQAHTPEEEIVQVPGTFLPDPPA